MKRISLMLMVVGISTLVGCSNIDEAKKSVALENQRVERVLSSYDENKTVASGYEVAIRDAIKTDMNSGLELPLSDKTLNGRLGTSIHVVYNTISSYLMERNDINTMEGREYDNIDLDSFIDNAIKYSYYLNDDNGVVVQMCMIRMPNGVINRIDFSWLGGKLFNVETSVNR